MVDVLTAAGQLALATEFRFDVWCAEHEHRYITVKRGHGKIPDKWAIADGESAFGRFWDGELWNFGCMGADAYQWDLEEALVIAKDLAISGNREMVEMMERRFPGQYRGGPLDFAAEGQT